MRLQKKLHLFSARNLFERPERNYKFIDGIRAIAILWVILFHVWLFQSELDPEFCGKVTNYPFLTWITRGDLGVDLFFVISGFLIGNLLFKEVKRSGKIRIKRFYIRRFLRLMPAYVACIIGGALLSKGTPLENWNMAWINLLYVNNYVPHSYMPWTWSLAIEEQFYLVIPFVILFVFPRLRNKIWFFLPLALLSPILKYYFTTYVLDYSWPMQSVFYDSNWHNWFWDYYVLTHFRYGGLLAGVIIAYLHNYHREKVQGFFESSSKAVSVLACIGLVFIVLISSISLGQWSNVENSTFSYFPSYIGNFYEAIHREVFYYSVAFIITACLYSSTKVINGIKSFLSLKFFFPIAQVSYSAYLFHEMFMYLYFRGAKGWLEQLSMAKWSVLVFNGIVSLIAVLFVAALMFIFIEQPFQRLKEKWGK